MGVTHCPAQVLDDPTINKDEESGDKSDTPEPEREDGEEEGDKEEPVFEEGFPSFDCKNECN